MKKTIALAAVAAAVSLPVSADEAYQWPLCEDINPLIEASRAPTPFIDLTERTRSGDSFGVMPGLTSLGMKKGRNCSVYIAGTPEGVRGGGEWNYVECAAWRSSPGDTPSRSQLDAKRSHIAGMLGTCAGLAGWRFALPENPGYARAEEGWTNPETGAQVVVERKEGRGRSRTAEIKFIVRAPNPSYTPPPDPE